MAMILGNFVEHRFYDSLFSLEPVNEIRILEQQHSGNIQPRIVDAALFQQRQQFWLTEIDARSTYVDQLAHNSPIERHELRVKAERKG